MRKFKGTHDLSGKPLVNKDDAGIPKPDGTGPIAILGVFESASSPGKKYEVRVGSDEVVYCTCPGWRHHRNCKHIKGLGLKPGRYQA